MPTQPPNGGDHIVLAMIATGLYATTHQTIVSERTDVLVPMIEAFLEAPMPEGA